MIGSPGINIKLIQYIECVITLIQQYWEVAAWEQARNASPRPVIWRFTTPDARIKLKRLYPSIQDG